MSDGEERNCSPGGLRKGVAVAVEIDASIHALPPPTSSSSSSPCPVSLPQKLGALSLAAEEDPSTTIDCRSISLADGLASLASASSPARSTTGSFSSSSVADDGGGDERQEQQVRVSSWPGFANVLGSSSHHQKHQGDFESVSEDNYDDENWVEATDRAIEEMGDPTTLPSALERLSRDPNSPGDVCESACWDDYVYYLPGTLLDERPAVAAAAAALAAEVMEEAVGGGGGGLAMPGNGCGCDPGQLSDLLAAAATALGQASCRAFGCSDSDGGDDGSATAVAAAAAEASAALAARALDALPRSWPAAREGVLSRACKAAASLMPPPSLAGAGAGGEARPTPAPPVPWLVRALSSLLLLPRGDSDDDGDENEEETCLVFSWLHRWAGTPRVAKHLFAALGAAGAESHADAVSWLRARSRKKEEPRDEDPLQETYHLSLSLSVAISAAALGSSAGRGLLSDPDKVAADLCSLATATSFDGDDDRSSSSFSSSPSLFDPSGFVVSSARLGVLQLASSSPAALSCGGESAAVGELLAPLTSLLRELEEEEGGSARSTSSRLSPAMFASTTLCLLCRTTEGVDAVLRAEGGGRAKREREEEEQERDKEGPRIAWPLPPLPSPSSFVSRLARLRVRSQDGDSKQKRRRKRRLSGPLLALERALSSDPVAALHFRRGTEGRKDPTVAEVALALVSRGSPAALASLALGGSNATKENSLALSCLSLAEEAVAAAVEANENSLLFPPHAVAVAAAVALAEAAPSAAAARAAKLAAAWEGEDKGEEGGEGRAAFGLPVSSVAAGVEAAKAAMTTKATTAPSPHLPEWCSRELQAIEALLVRESKEKTSGDSGKETNANASAAAAADASSSSKVELAATVVS